jgi:hypothetical protein
MPRSVVASAAAASACALAAIPAHAEAPRVRWDVGAEVGAWQRFARAVAPGAPHMEVGPGAEVQAHVALAPMVRAGAYAAYDVAPVPGQTVREFVEGGLRVKVTPPILRHPWRAWVFAGVGYAWAYQPSYEQAIAGRGVERVPGAFGGILDVPFGVGLGLRMQPEWTLFAELGGRASLFATGGLEDAAFCLCRSAFVGKDSFAVGLSVGVSWGQ